MNVARSLAICMPPDGATVAQLAAMIGCTTVGVQSIATEGAKDVPLSARDAD